MSLLCYTYLIELLTQLEENNVGNFFSPLSHQWAQFPQKYSIEEHTTQYTLCIHQEEFVSPIPRSSFVGSGPRPLHLLWKETLDSLNSLPKTHPLCPRTFQLVLPWLSLSSAAPPRLLFLSGLKAPTNLSRKAGRESQLQPHQPGGLAPSLKGSFQLRGSSRVFTGIIRLVLKKF